MKRDSFLFGFVRILFHVAIIIFAILVIREYALKAYDFGYRIFKEPPVTIIGEGKKITINLTKDVSLKSLGELLEAKGLIKDSTLFVAQYYCSEYKDDLKPGTYELKSSMTAEEMFAVMAGHGEDEEK